MRVAVVGSGPAAFYAAAHLLASEDPVAEVDMIERLPTAWGLVRLGVAPDHPNLKTVSRAFERIAQRPGFRFFGNVEVGRDVTQADLARLYDAVVYAVGAQTDRRLGIPARIFPDPGPQPSSSPGTTATPTSRSSRSISPGERAVVVGNGNVALDVARMLALTREELAPTDTTDPAIEAIAESGIREIVVLGRRGPVQAAWTSTELQEMGELAGADIVVDPAELELDAASEAELEAGSNIVQRNFEILRGFAAREPTGKPRVRLRFRVSPVAILGDGKVEAVELAHNALEPDGEGSVRAVATEERETIPAGIVFRSVGYHGVPLPTCPSTRSAGRSRTPAAASSTSRAGHLRALRGGLDQARPDRRHRDEQEGRDGDGRPPARGRARRPPPAAEGDATLDSLLAERGVEAVMYAGWEAIDVLERGRGEPHGRPRIKLCPGTSFSPRARGLDSPSWRRRREGKELWAGRPARRSRTSGVGRADSGARRALARPDQGRRGARQRRARPARRGEGRAHRGGRRPHRSGRVRRPVPDRRLPDRLRHQLEHERERGHRRARGRGRAPERRREHGPVVERRLPLGRAPRRARRAHERPAARARPARRVARAQGWRVRRRRQVGPHAHDGRRPGDPRPGVRGLRGAGPQGIARIEDALPRLGQIPLGGTATGTGLNTHPEFAQRVRALLAEQTGLAISRPPTRSRRRPPATPSSRPRAPSRSSPSRSRRSRATCDSWAPARARGSPSSSSPTPEGELDHAGKVNPVIPEVVTQVGAQVIGNDTAIAIGGMNGQFELNVYVPLMARNLLQSINLLASASRLLADKCVDGIEANREQLERYAEATLSAATALNPQSGTTRPPRSSPSRRGRGVAPRGRPRRRCRRRDLDRRSTTRDAKPHD